MLVYLKLIFKLRHLSPLFIVECVNHHFDMLIMCLITVQYIFVKAQLRGDEGCCDRETKDARSLFFSHNRSVTDDLDHCCFAILFIRVEKFDCNSPNFFHVSLHMFYICSTLLPPQPFEICLWRVSNCPQSKICTVKKYRIPHLNIHSVIGSPFFSFICPFGFHLLTFLQTFGRGGRLSQEFSLNMKS